MVLEYKSTNHGGNMFTNHRNERISSHERYDLGWWLHHQCRLCGDHAMWLDWLSDFGIFGTCFKLSYDDVWCEFSSEDQLFSLNVTSWFALFPLQQDILMDLVFAKMADSAHIQSSCMVESSGYWKLLCCFIHSQLRYHIYRHLIPSVLKLHPISYIYRIHINVYIHT